MSCTVAAALGLGGGDGKGGGLGQSDGFWVLNVGVHYLVGRFPMVSEGPCAATAVELCSATVLDYRVRSCGTGHGGLVYSDVLGLGAGAAPVTTACSEGDGIIAGLGVWVRGTGLVRGLPVAKVPQVAYALVGRVGGGAVGELGAFAFAHGVGGEVGGGFGINSDLGGGVVGLVSYSDGASVGARVCRVAIGESWVLLVGTVIVGTCPMISSPLLSVGCQMDGIAYAIWSVVVDQRWQNATVGLAISSVFLESNVTTTSGIIGNEEDKILSYLSVDNVSVFVRIDIITTVMKVAIGIVAGT